MSISGIQGQLLEVTVVGCHKLKDTEWIARQDPYVCIEYGTSKFRTRTCTDGGKNPTFQEKFVLNLVEGLQELKVVVWNSNTLTYDDFIGSGNIQLYKALMNGYDDCAWTLVDKKGRRAGEIKLTMRRSNENRPVNPLGHVLSSNHLASTSPHASHFPSHPLVASHADRTIPEPFTYPSYPPTPIGFPPTPYHQPAAYPPAYPSPLTAYPPQQETIYPPPGLYPPTGYPPPSQY